MFWVCKALCSTGSAPLPVRAWAPAGRLLCGLLSCCLRSAATVMSEPTWHWAIRRRRHTVMSEPTTLSSISLHCHRLVMGLRRAQRGRAWAWETSVCCLTTIMLISLTLSLISCFLSSFVWWCLTTSREANIGKSSFCNVRLKACLVAKVLVLKNPKRLG